MEYGWVYWLIPALVERDFSAPDLARLAFEEMCYTAWDLGYEMLPGQMRRMPNGTAFTAVRPDSIVYAWPVIKP